mgnify:CR=1 FL=1
MDNNFEENDYGFNDFEDAYSNELNADEYLDDHLHMNLAGRKKVAERFVYALEYYDE